MTAWEGILGPGNRRHLLNGIATSPRLTEMNLKLSFNPPTGWLHRVLQSLPPTIKVVRCQWGRVIDNGSSVAASEERAIQLARQQSPKEYPYLVYADLKIFLAYGEEDDLITFVKHCPSLKAMNIPRPTNGDVLTRLIQRMEEMPFPRNSRVSFNTGAVTQIRDTHWRRLLLSLSDHIQGFATRLPFNSSFARGYISAMTSSWSHLLETIEIDQAQQITSSDIQVILTTCPKLKKLDCLFPWIGTMFGEGDDFTEEGWESFPGLEAMVRDDDKGEPLAMVDWVCTDLEELSLTFADGRRLEVDDDTLSKQEKWTERGIQHIYNQLGRLSKLQYLAIGWSTSAIFSDYANLNMSLKSGLHHLSGLDELKVLDLNHLCEIHINSPEVDWILEHWPNLTKLRGIDFRVEQPWPEHLTRLWTKPNMIIE
ncbi:hypothetical protein BGX31_007751 [Mortierella sp. GBA43]|nr:hypothetical protein BGX31_007751 [Mortierella sp. GBA43]